jgi:LPS sulfotransferase NodH
VITPSHTGSYMICATPRSGSTLLCGLLRDTGVAGRPESYFRRPDEQSWAERWQLERDSEGSFDHRDYVRAAVTDGSTDNGVFGVRVMWGTLDEMVANLENVNPSLAGADLDLLTSAFGSTRFVHLWRGDTVAQAVSWARAEQTNFWHPGEGAVPVREPSFDADQIRQLVDTIDEHNAAWRRWFATFGVQPLSVRYEDLTADMADTVRRILAHIGVESPSDLDITPRHQRQADEINRDWIERYHARRGGCGPAVGPPSMEPACGALSPP